MDRATPSHPSSDGCPAAVNICPSVPRKRPYTHPGNLPKLLMIKLSGLILASLSRGIPPVYDQSLTVQVGQLDKVIGYQTREGQLAGWNAR